MRTTEIGTDTVTFYFKNEAGETVRGEMSPADRTFIANRIDKGDDKGKMSVGNDITLFWAIEF